MYIARAINIISMPRYIGLRLSRNTSLVINAVVFAVGQIAVPRSLNNHHALIMITNPVMAATAAAAVDDGKARLRAGAM